MKLHTSYRHSAHHHHHHHRHHRLYNHGWALASSRKCRQRTLSSASARQFLQFSVLASFSTPSMHHDFSCPRLHCPLGFARNIFLGNSLSSILTTWPDHLSLLDCITSTLFIWLTSYCLFEGNKKQVHIFVISHHCRSMAIKGKGHPCTGTEALYRPYGP